MAFTSAGFSNWRKAIERKHEKSSSHRVNIRKFEAIVRGENVHAQIDSQDKKERIIASECLLKIFTTLRFFARQGFALRCHEDAEQLLLLRTDDSQEHRKWLQKKKTFTSVDIQDEILQMMADQLVRTLARTVRNRKFYGLIADETADISRMEQLAICLRCVSDDLIVDD